MFDDIFGKTVDEPLEVKAPEPCGTCAVAGPTLGFYDVSRMLADLFDNDMVRKHIEIDILSVRICDFLQDNCAFHLTAKESKSLAEDMINIMLGCNSRLTTLNPGVAQQAQPGWSTTAKQPSPHNHPSAPSSNHNHTGPTNNGQYPPKKQQP